MKLINIYNINYQDIRFQPYNYSLPANDPQLNHYYTIPKWIKKQHPKNKWRITFNCFNIMDAQGVGSGNPDLRMFGIDGLDNKSYFSNTGYNQAGDGFLTNIPSSNALFIGLTGAKFTNVNSYLTKYDASIICIDDLPQNPMLVRFQLVGVDYIFWAQPSYIGFNMRIEEISNSPELIENLIWQPTIYKTYNQTFRGSANRTTFKFDPTITKKNKNNKWLATITGIAIDGQSQTGIMNRGLAINGFNGMCLPEDTYLDPPIYLWLRIGSNSTPDGIIVQWLDENEIILATSTVFVAGASPPSFSTAYVECPQEYNSLVKTARLTVLDNDGFTADAVIVNGIPSTNLGFIDLDSTTGQPAYRDYPTTVSLLDNLVLTELKNYTLIGYNYMDGIGQSGFWTISSFMYDATKFIITDITRELNVILFGYNILYAQTNQTTGWASPILLSLVPVDDFEFSVRLEEIE